VFIVGSFFLFCAIKVFRFLRFYLVVSLLCKQCFSSGSALILVGWIRIRIGNADPENKNNPQNRKKGGYKFQVL
jgi:hypothetical protein